MKQSKIAEEARPRLGRGLAALLGGAETLAAATRTRGQQKIPIEFLRPNPRNPRRNFGEESLDEGWPPQSRKKASFNQFSRAPCRARRMLTKS